MRKKFAQSFLKLFGIKYSENEFLSLHSSIATKEKKKNR